MYRRVLPLLLTAVLLLSGCSAGQKNMPQKTDEKEMTDQPSDMSGEGSMYMDTTENVIYLAGGCDAAGAPALSLWQTGREGPTPMHRVGKPCGNAARPAPQAPREG